MDLNLHQGQKRADRPGLIAFDGTVFQVLELPASPVSSSADQRSEDDQAAIGQLADRSLKRMVP